jgi:hypothetical protein
MRNEINDEIPITTSSPVRQRIEHSVGNQSVVQQDGATMQYLLQLMARQHL